MLGRVDPARRWLVFLSAAIAAVLTMLLPATAAPGAAVAAAGTRVGASHSQTILTVGRSAGVFPVQPRGEATLQPHLGVGACVAAEGDAGEGLAAGKAEVETVGQAFQKIGEEIEEAEQTAEDLRDAAENVAQTVNSLRGVPPENLISNAPNPGRI